MRMVLTVTRVDVIQLFGTSPNGKPVDLVIIDIEKPDVGWFAWVGESSVRFFCERGEAPRALEALGLGAFG